MRPAASFQSIVRAPMSPSASVSVCVCVLLSASTGSLAEAGGGLYVQDVGNISSVSVQFKLTVFN